MNVSWTGILGGTFDPPHLGHLNLARALREHLGLAQVRLVLSARPPHKDNRLVSPASVRWRMLCAAVGGEPGLSPSDVELQRAQPSWTIDTVARLAAQEPEVRWVFLTGSEGFLQVRTWKRYRELLQMLPFAVLLRRPEEREEVLDLVAAEGWPLLDRLEGAGPGGGCLLLDLQVPHLELSSTRIREALRCRDAAWVRTRVPGPVWEIIEKERLYGA